MASLSHWRRKLKSGLLFDRVVREILSLAHLQHHEIVSYWDIMTYDLKFRPWHYTSVASISVLAGATPHSGSRIAGPRATPTACSALPASPRV